MSVKAPLKEMGPAAKPKGIASDMAMLIVIPLVCGFTMIYYARMTDLVALLGGAFLGIALALISQRREPSAMNALEAALETLAIGGFVFLFLSVWDLMIHLQLILSLLAMALLSVFWGYLLVRTLARRTSTP
jgi:hypothetical protein